ncbi:MAG: GNAT family N-acetyltransferase [Rhodanobacter sp.]
MSVSPAIRVTPVDASLSAALLNLRVQPTQQNFVGSIVDLLADAAARPSCEAMAILYGENAIGFYRIEPNARSVTGRDFELPTLGLRAFFLDAHWQGQGWGAKALDALLTDLAVRHPQARRLVLTVHACNAPALALYGHAGFVDSGERYHGGHAGPQHLLWRDLT